MKSIRKFCLLLISASLFHVLTSGSVPIRIQVRSNDLCAVDGSVFSMMKRIFYPTTISNAEDLNYFLHVIFLAIDGRVSLCADNWPFIGKDMVDEIVSHIIFPGCALALDLCPQKELYIVHRDRGEELQAGCFPKLYDHRIVFGIGRIKLTKEEVKAAQSKVLIIDGPEGYHWQSLTSDLENF